MAAWIRRHLHLLRDSWHSTDGCLVPDCEERAMHFPPSRFCKAHTHLPARSHYQTWCEYHIRASPDGGSTVSLPGKNATTTEFGAR
jgi:hypothetical protein